MIRHVRKPIVVRIALALLIAAPVLGIVFVPSMRIPVLIARHLETKLKVTPDSLLEEHMRQIAALDESGTPILVRALGNPRKTVAHAAERALYAQLDRWARMPAKESNPRVALLAQLLADHVERWDAEAQCVAADLVARLLRWPIHAKSMLVSEFIANCERVVQVAPSFDLEKVDIAQAIVESSNTRALHDTARGHFDSDNDLREAVRIPLTDLPGGDLPIEEVSIPPLPPSLAEPPTPQPIVGEEPHLISPDGQQLPRTVFPSHRPPNELEPPRSRAIVPRELDTRKKREMHSHAPRVRPTGAATRASERLDQLSDLELIRCLSGEPAVQRAAEQVLRQRGFDAVGLNLARRVADPNPEVRRQLAESLADLRTSPSPWLFWLSYDPDPSVRQLVVALMATSQDPRLRRRLREMESLETDEAVSALLKRISEKRTRR